MPGGYDEYLVSLRSAAEFVHATRPTPTQLQLRMQTMFERELTRRSAYDRWRGLCRAGLLTEVDGECVLTDACEAWRVDDDPARLITQVHRNIRFFGELLAQLDNPMTTDELRHAANEGYLMGWQATTQIDNRRGWLQSAGMIEQSKVTGKLTRTNAGADLLARLEVEPRLG